VSGNNGTNDPENADEAVRGDESSPERAVPEREVPEYDPSSAPTVQFSALNVDDAGLRPDEPEESRPDDSQDPVPDEARTDDSHTDEAHADASRSVAERSDEEPPTVAAPVSVPEPDPVDRATAGPEADDSDVDEADSAVTQPVVRASGDAPSSAAPSSEAPSSVDRPSDDAALSDAPTAAIPVLSGTPDAPGGGRPGPSAAVGDTGAGRPDDPQDRTSAIPPQSPPPPVPPVPAEPAPGGPPGDGSGPSKRTLALIVGGVFTVLAALYVIDLAVSSGKVPRGVTVAGIDIGGEPLDEVAGTLQAQLDPRLDTAVAVTAGDTDGELVPSQVGIGIDWNGTLARIGAQPLNPFTRLASFFGTDEIGVVSTRDDAALVAGIESVAAGAAHEPREGNIVFEDGTPVPVTPQPGQSVDTAVAADVFAERWAFGDVSLPVESVEVTVTREGLDQALADIAVPAVAADLHVNGHDAVVATLRTEDIGAVLSFVPDGSGGLEPQYDREAATGLLAPQLAETEVEPENARIVIQGGAPTVVPGTKGEVVDWEQTLADLPRLLATENDRSVDARYETADPELTTEGAEKLGVREVIGEFTTGGFEYASGVNIRLAASEINGALVEPGETFSLNGYTGPRGSAQGYVESGIIEAGRPGKAVGGGISQLATTLYNASYFAGMEDVDHTEHSYYISRYPAAREATVFEGAIDLQFRNPFETGVLIETIGTDSAITVRLWGTKTVDVQSITGDRTNYTSPNTITLPAGDSCIPSSGAQGFTVSDTRIITDAKTGAQLSAKTRTVRYDPVPVVKCVSPEPKPGQKPEEKSEEQSEEQPAEQPEEQPAEQPESGGAADEPSTPASPTPAESE